MLPDWSLKRNFEMEIFIEKPYFTLPVKLFEAVLPVQYVPIQRTKLIECYLSTLVSVKHALHNGNLSKCQNLLWFHSPIIMLIVVMLNSVPFPLTRAACNSWGVIVPDLFASTLQWVPWYGFSINKFNLSVRVPIKICPQFVVRRHVWWWRRGTLWLVSRHCSNLFYISLLLENVNVFLLRLWLWVKRHK